MKNVYGGSVFKGIDKIVGNDPLRESLSFAVIKGGKIVATDAHCLVEVDLSMYSIVDDDISKLEGKCISRDTLQKFGSLKKNDKWFFDDNGLNVLRSNSDKVKVTYPINTIEDEGIRFPNYEAVIPSQFEPTESISFKGEFLVKLENVIKGTCMENDILKINFSGSSRGLVLNNENGGFRGLIMPIMLNF